MCMLSRGNSHFCFGSILTTVSTNTVAHMWNADRKAVFIRVIDALDVVVTISPDHIKIEIRADAGYDSRENFQTCKEYGITPIIRIRRNAEYTAKGVSRERGIAALDQLGGSITNLVKFHEMDIRERTENQNEWKKRVEYGSRWQVEIFFSAFKRIFGSSVRAKTMDNIIQEITLKIQATTSS